MRVAGSFTLTALLWLLLRVINCRTAPQVREIQPRTGSTWGATKIKILGTGFSSDQFNHGAGRENLGNLVYLVSEAHAVECPVHKFDTGPEQIVCITPSRMLPVEYLVRIMVDGAEVSEANHCPSNPDLCKFTPGESKTPTITNIEPDSGLPGTLITITGMIMTTRYLMTDSHSTNERQTKLVKVYAGSDRCELRSDDDNVFEISLDKEGRSDHGHFKCVILGDYVGNINASFILNEEYGRSRPAADLLKVAGNGQIHMFQTYAEITSIQAFTGGNSGASILEINGRFFDKTKAPASVDVGGNRGLLFERWTTRTKAYADLADILTLNDTEPDYRSQVTNDFSFYTFEEMFVSRFRGFFVPPSDNDYEFFIKADDSARLYFSESDDPSAKTEIAVCSTHRSEYTIHAEQKSRVFSLLKGKKYYIEAVQNSYGHLNGISVAVRVSNTDVTNQMTALAAQAKQKLSVTSTVKHEIQTLHVPVMESNITAMDELQRIEVSIEAGAVSDGKFRLGLYNVFTGILGGSSSARDVQTALENLPMLQAGALQVTMDTINETVYYNVSFVDGSGDMPLLEYRVEPGMSGELLNITVTEVMAGQPKLDKFRLKMDGIVSDPISIPATASKISAAITSMMSVRCPSFLEKPNRAKTGYTDEFDNSEMVEEPFCGRSSRKNINPFYRNHNTEDGINIQAYPIVCMAYRGYVKPYFYSLYGYKSQSNSIDTSYAWIKFNFPFEQGTEWRYMCLDLYTKMKDHRLPSTNHRVFRVNLVREPGKDFYVDTFSFVKQATTDDFAGINLQRMQAITGNGKRVKTATVTDEGSGVFNITLVPFDCGDQFSLFEIANAELTTGGSSNQSSAAQYTLETASFNVTRTQPASPPVHGSFIIQFEGNATVPASATAEQLEDILGTVGATGVKVERSLGCSSYYWTIEWILRGGRVPNIEITDSSNLRGIDAAVAQSVVTDGALWYDPIPGEFLRTPHKHPQVMAYINTIPTSCANNSDCRFEVKVEDGPTIVSVSPTSGASNPPLSVTISGTKFSSNTSKNDVKIGGVSCEVTSSMETSITCTIGHRVAGAANIVVVVGDESATQLASGAVTFTYSAVVITASIVTSVTKRSVAPSVAGSPAGGATLIVTGAGFSPTDTVTVGGTDCPVVSRSTIEIKCTVPRANTMNGGLVDIVVSTVGGSITPPTQFNYNNGRLVTATNLSPTTASAQGGDNITITGSGFGASATDFGRVVIGGKPATIISYSDTTVIVKTPPLTPGSHVIEFFVDAFGLVDMITRGVSSVNVVMKVTRIFPDRGSLYGSTDLYIAGSGFTSQSDLIKVKVGDTDCDVMSSTPTNVMCRIAVGGKTHRVTNDGSSPKYGRGYAWLPNIVTIRVGDTVHWSWKTPKFVKSVKYKIQQVVSPLATEGSGGFDSGEKSPTGSYKHTFSEVGTYHYWSDYYDSEGLAIRGVVKVVPIVSNAAPVRVKVNGIEATYDTSATVPTPTIEGCAWDVASIVGCIDPEPSAPNNTYFYHKFWQCSSLSVTRLASSSLKTTTLDNIIINGSDFMTVDCQNEVFFGDYRCLVTSSSVDALICRMDTSMLPPIGQYLPLSVRVSNRGAALIKIVKDIDRMIVLYPVIGGISQTSGSTQGGTALTISGSGFGETEVKIGGSECVIISRNYTEIVCETPAKVDGVYEVTVTVSVDNVKIAAECRASPNCMFEYRTSDTPSVTSVTPLSVSASATTITIVGQKLSNVVEEVTVMLGLTKCSVQTASTTQVTCNTGDLTAGSHSLSLYIRNKGIATGSFSVTSTPTLTSVSPSSGSIHGGQEITISGYGFHATNVTSVAIASSSCDITSATIAQVVCRTGSGSGAATLTVVSNGVTFPTLSYTYDSSTTKTPVVSSLSMTSGTENGVTTIRGEGFGSTGQNKVMVGSKMCVILSETSVIIVCQLVGHRAGTFPVQVHVAAKGYSNNDHTFTYTLRASNVSPASGSYAGQQTLTVTGSGLDSNTTVTICGNPCAVQSGVTATSLNCLTPSNPGTGATLACDVVVTSNTESVTLSGQYTYDQAKTAVVTGVSPARGGTMGGTSLTISGTGFSSVADENIVTIDGVNCTISAAQATEITCTTGSNAGRTVEAEVRVYVKDYGIAKPVSASFHYIDVWSSRFTWNNQDPPKEGELVVIPKGQTLLLDTDTPTLAMLLIQGELIFDEKDITLNANNILISDGGLLQVGTENEPFRHKATIQMWGHFRSKELPIYGTKTIAVREGTLDLHGIPKRVTWTTLASTANSGDTSITLKEPVDWSVGDEIVIATTGDHHSQKESEIRVISSLSNGNETVHFAEALKYTHISVSESLGGQTVEFRAEVGLLTRNVVVRGSRDANWDVQIEACPDGFDTGEFATQTCFQGRFGAEMGSDQFGACIMFHAPQSSSGQITARLEYVEVTHAGQAFRLGRYPIHFHMNGDMPGAYVRGCSIHRSFNRALVIHGTHYTLAEYNVIYDIMGGAVFLEDGVEIGNTIQYNLGVFVRSSSSLLNDDITPAFIWGTNPNNTVQHNAAAGGTHFGYWYRMEEHPGGPSFTKNYCPQHVPLGIFRNNSAHAVGWFGLWTMESYFPMEGGGCNSKVAEPAVFESLFAWNCRKGAEFVNAGSIIFKDFVLVNNLEAGMEGKKIITNELFTEKSPSFMDSMIVGKATSLSTPCTPGAMVLPYNQGMVIRGMKFVNFNDPGCVVIRWTRIQGTCITSCGGFTYQSIGLTFINSPNKGHFAWTHEGVIKDLDGSLAGVTDGTVVSTVNTLPTGQCSSTTGFTGVPVSVCRPPVKFHRFAFHHIKPSSLDAKNLIMTNEFGSDVTPWQKKRMTHKKGWMVTLPSGYDYKIEFENGEHMENISYEGRFDLFDDGDYLIMKQRLTYSPDRFMFEPKKPINQSTTRSLTYEGNVNSDWLWNSDTNDVEYMLSYRTSRAKRSAPEHLMRSVHFQAYRCYYPDCLPPPDSNSVPPVSGRPAGWRAWSKNETWADIIKKDGTYGKPSAGEDVTIPKGVWIVLDEDFPTTLGILTLAGTLEVSNEQNFTLSVNHIYILGGRLIIGWTDSLYKGQGQIILRGDVNSPRLPADGGVEVGAKAIGVFGGLDLHGKEHDVIWTTLNKTANKGENFILLSEEVDWSVGDEIVIAPTGYDPWETETFRITAVTDSGTRLTLNGTLRYRHVVYGETVNSTNYKMAAEVGLLTRNLKVIGQDYPDLYKNSFGGRVVVGLMVNDSKSYLGFARISNVEFYHMGQEGFTEPYDPRFALAFVDGGKVSKARPSYVKSNAFHHCFSTAVGVFGTEDLLIENNVIHHTVYSAINSESSGTMIVKNLALLMVFPGTYQDRLEKSNLKYMGSIDTRKADKIVLRNNVVAGSERIGYRVRGEPCSNNPADDWTGNTAHSSIIGFGIFPDDSLSSDCTKIANFFVYKNSDFGFYVNVETNVVATGNIFVDNTLSLFPYIKGPSATSHETAERWFEVKRSLFVGESASFDCAEDVIPTTDANQVISAHGRPRMNAALTFPNMMSGSNGVPEKPFVGIMTYPGINGVMRVTDNVFAHFTETCLTNKRVILTTNKGNDDGQHPVEMERNLVIDAKRKNYIFMHRPDISKIDSSNCVDMDCDGKKKALISDKDGSFLGTPGHVFSQSEFEWGINGPRGLGDFRIPKVMLTEPNGAKIDVNVKAPNKGIIRSENCSYNADWQAHECRDYNYRMLIIESMDADTEKRRISPVGILGEKYIDLINGPQDHGWCSGYTCRLRLSTFMAMVATGKHYEIVFTGTTPQNMRYHLLNSLNSESISLSVWYSQPNRLDVYYNDLYIMPTNGDYDANGKYILKKPTGDEYEVKPGDPSGRNYFKRERSELHFVITGPKPVYVKTAPVLVVTFNFKMMTVDEFYGPELINNLASFLDIPKEKIRIVNVVKETRRRRRAVSEETKVTVEISNQQTNGTNSTDGDLSFEKLTDVGANLAAGIQTGQIDQALNLTIVTAAVTEPIAPPGDPAYSVSSDEERTIVNLENYITILGHLELEFDNTSADLHESDPFPVYPVIKGYDKEGGRIAVLGTPRTPWQFSVNVTGLNATSSGERLYNHTIPYQDSAAIFNFLAISTPGFYQLTFYVSYPTTNVSALVAFVEIKPRGLGVKVTASPEKLVMSRAFDLTVRLTSEESGLLVNDISWRNHTWNVSSTLLRPDLYEGFNDSYTSYGGLANGPTSAKFDPSTNYARLSNVSFPTSGRYHILFTVTSDPPEYQISREVIIDVMSDTEDSVVVEKSSTLKFTFDVPYSSYIQTAADKQYFITRVTNDFRSRYPNVIIVRVDVAPGSIVVIITVQGTTSDVSSVMTAVCSSADSRSTFVYQGSNIQYGSTMSVDGKQFDTATCTEKLTKKETADTSGLSMTVIIVIAVCCSLFVIIVVAVIVWYVKFKPKNKTVDIHDMARQLGTDAALDKVLFRTKGFSSNPWNSKDVPPPAHYLPPIGTKLPPLKNPPPQHSMP